MANDPLATFYQQYYPTAVDIQPYMPGAGYIEPQHQGVDIAGIPVGSNVELPVGGVYQQSLSNPYMSVFKIANGTYEGILHITATAFPDQAPVGAGQVVGTVSPLVGWPVTFPGGSTSIQDYNNGPSSSYFSTEPHIHIDNYANPADASVAYGGSSTNPELLPVGSGVSSYPPGVTPPPNMNPGQTTPVSPGDVAGAINGINGAINGILHTQLPTDLPTTLPNFSSLKTNIAGVVLGLLIVFVGIAFIVRVNPVKIVSKI